MNEIVLVQVILPRGILVRGGSHPQHNLPEYPVTPDQDIKELKEGMSSRAETNAPASQLMGSTAAPSVTDGDGR
ncbi:hypothetical protein J6590_068349 [Homalodisca vitripennis]|nr:hypothetical protein J6590_068349 [Homalodisca vitripennis]